MNYLLDTNACISYMRVRRSKVRQHASMLADHEIVLCSVVRAELFYGIYRSAKQSQELTKVIAFVKRFVSLPFDNPAAEQAAYIKATLASSGWIISPHDIQIAAIALVNNLTLITHNVREFSRVKGLAYEDWEV